MMEEKIEGKSYAFKKYLQSFLNKEEREVLESIANQRKVFIFSGIIRDFFVGEKKSVRDIDIVLDRMSGLRLPRNFFNQFKIEINKFGGFKCVSDSLTIDAWNISKTWGIRHMGLPLTPEALIQTAFFNFSAIVYDYNNERFVYGDDFQSFYSTGVMNVVYEDNPNDERCLLDIFHYHTQESVYPTSAENFKYRFQIGGKLLLWISKHYKPIMDFHRVQLRRYGRLLYQPKSIHEFCNAVSAIVQYEVANGDIKEQSFYIPFFRGGVSNNRILYCKNGDAAWYLLSYE